MARAVLKPFHGQQIMAGDGQMQTFQFRPSRLLILSTEQP